MKVCMPPVVTETAVRNACAQIESAPDEIIEIDFRATLMVSLAAERLIQQCWDGQKRIRQLRKPKF